MIITINTAEDLTDLDKTVLTLLVDGGAAPGVTATVTPIKEAPAAKKAAAPAKKAAAPAKAPEPVVEEPAEEVEEDLMGDQAPTLDDALAAAKKLIQGGKQQTVKDALATVGVKRVSELDEGTIPAFLAELG